MVEIIKNSEEYRSLSFQEPKDNIAKTWTLVHDIASLVAVGMLVYDEDEILEVLR